MRPPQRRCERRRRRAGRHSKAGPPAACAPPRCDADPLPGWPEPVQRPWPGRFRPGDSESKCACDSESKMETPSQNVHARCRRADPESQQPVWNLNSTGPPPRGWDSTEFDGEKGTRSDSPPRRGLVTSIETDRSARGALTGDTGRLEVAFSTDSTLQLLARAVWLQQPRRFVRRSSVSSLVSGWTNLNRGGESTRGGWIPLKALLCAIHGRGKEIS